MVIAAAFWVTPKAISAPTISSQLATLKASGANVMFGVVLGKFTSQMIKGVAELNWKPVHILDINATSVGAVMKPAGLEASKGVISVNYGKDPLDPTWKDDPGMKKYFEFMAKYYPDGDKDSSFNSYGYSTTQLLIHVLKACGDNLTRENVMKQAASIKDLQLPMLLPGVKVNTSPTDFAPIEQEQLAKFDGERWVIFGDLYDASKK